MKGKFYCEHGNMDSLDKGLLFIAASIEREITPLELEISSGFRCIECNKKVGGSPNSAHLWGKALDIVCESSSIRMSIIKALVNRDIKRIETSNKHIHYDIDNSLPQNVFIVAWIK